VIFGIYADLFAVVLGAIGYRAKAASSELAVVPTTDDVDSLDAVQLLMDRDDDTSVSRQYQSRGVTAEASAITASIPVNESMLMLLLQLFRRFSRAGVYRLSLLAGAQSVATEVRVGDAEFYVCRVLDRVCAESSECADVIKSLSQQLTMGGDASQQEDANQEDKDKRHGFHSAL